MATVSKRKSAYLGLMKQEIFVHSYGQFEQIEFEHYITGEKTVAVTKESNSPPEMGHSGWKQKHSGWVC